MTRKLLSGLFFGAVLVAWVWLQWLDFDEEQRERQEERIRKEVSEKVGKELEAASKERQEKLRRDLQKIVGDARRRDAAPTTAP